MVLGSDLDQGCGLGTGLGTDLEHGWEFDQESHQESLQDPAQEFDQDMELGRSQVGRGSLGHDQVSALHHSHHGSECTVSGSLLLCEKQQEVSSVLRDGDTQKFKAI